MMEPFRELLVKFLIPEKCFDEFFVNFNLLDGELYLKCIDTELFGVCLVISGGSLGNTEGYSFQQILQVKLTAHLVVYIFGFKK